MRTIKEKRREGEKDERKELKKERGIGTKKGRAGNDRR